MMKTTMMTGRHYCRDESFFLRLKPKQCRRILGGGNHHFLIISFYIYYAGLDIKMKMAMYPSVHVEYPV